MNADQYRIATVKAVPNGDEVSAVEDRFEAVPGPGRNEVRAEASDGDDVTTFNARGLTILDAATQETLTHVEKSDVTVSLTDSRVTIGCSKYDTGGQWFGGVAALALEAGERAVAAVRTRNMMLVGLVRYPWIAHIFARNKMGWNKPPGLNLMVASATDRQFVVKFALEKHVDAMELGTELAQRVGLFRLQHDSVATTRYGEDLKVLTRLETLPNPGQNGGASVSPRHWKVSNASADIGRAANGETRKPD